MTAARGLLAAMALVAAASAATAAPDVLRGEQIYVRCMACHALASDRVGPRHCGLLGRRAGSVPGTNWVGALMNRSSVFSSQTSLEFFIAGE